MALDILVAGFDENIEKSVSLQYDEFSAIMSHIETNASFPVLEKVLGDFYGEREVYINELKTLETEIMSLKEQFDSGCTEEVEKFIDEFLGIVEYAIKNRRTIKFVGD